MSEVVTTGFEHHFKDADGYVIPIRPSVDHRGAAAILASASVIVEPHKLAEFTRALYAAAGQHIPDLPVIYDPALVGALIADLAKCKDGTKEYCARRLLDAGWRKP